LSCVRLYILQFIYLRYCLSNTVIFVHFVIVSEVQSEDTQAHFLPWCQNCIPVLHYLYCWGL